MKEVIDMTLHKQVSLQRYSHILDPSFAHKMGLLHQL